MPIILTSDLVDHIVDSLRNDRQALSKCTLISKQWLVRARYHHFNDTHIQLCEYHWNPQRCMGNCKRCITQFVLLVSSQHTTIPRAIRSLKLGGKTYWAEWYNFYKIVANAGGMENQRMVRAIFKHFQSVQCLEFSKGVHWFKPSRRSSNIIHRSFSSVKTLILNDISVYIGPRAIFMMQQMPNLEHLTISRISWPSKPGIPNNASRLLIFLVNIAGALKFVRPLARLGLYLSNVGSKTHRPARYYVLRKPLETLCLHVPVESDDVNNVFIDWILPQTSALDSIHTLTAYTTVFTEGTVSSTCLQRLLSATSPSLLHLRLNFKSYSNRAVVPADHFSTFPSSQLKIQSLIIHINGDTPYIWIPWMWSIIKAATPPTLTLLRLVLYFDMCSSEFLNLTTITRSSPETDITLGDIDQFLAVDRNRDLEQTRTRAPLRFEVIVEVVGGWRLPLEMRNPSAILELVRKVFCRCDASEILSVKICGLDNRDSWTWD